MAADQIRTIGRKAEKGSSQQPFSEARIRHRVDRQAWISNIRLSPFYTNVFARVTEPCADLLGVPFQLLASQFRALRFVRWLRACQP